MSGPTIGSLFSGYGGIDLGLKSIWPDARTAWVSDIEAGPCKVLAHRYPDAPNLGDITKIDWSQVEPVDIITGGSPCQDLSHAGKRAGMRPGTRSGLWASMHDAIDILRPSLVVWENVRGALSANATTGDVESCEFCMADRDGQPMRALGRVLGDLADIGYDAAWCGLRAADVGACHGRFRVFVLAWPADADGSGGDQWRHTAPREAEGWRAYADDRGRGGAPVEHLLRTVMADEDGGGPLRPDTAKERGQTLRLTGQILALTGDLLPTPRATDGTKGGPNQRGSSGDLMLPSAVAQLLPTLTGGSNASNVDNAKSPGFDNGGENFRQIIDEGRFGQYAPAIARHEAASGRTAPAPVEPTGKNGANRLSPRFTEWMMGLPDGWVTDVPGITRNDALKLCGNGVVPMQAEVAVRHLLEVAATASERVA